MFMDMDDFVCYRTWRHGVIALSHELWWRHGVGSMRIIEEGVRRIRGMTGNRVFDLFREIALNEQRLIDRGWLISTEPGGKQTAILEALRVPPKSMVIKERAFF